VGPGVNMDWKRSVTKADMTYYGSSTVAGRVARIVGRAEYRLDI